MADIPYGKIVRKTWDKDNFRSLSDQERLLLLYIWTGDQGTSSSAIHRFSVAKAAETLSWPVGRTQKIFKKLQETGWFLYDTEHRVIFLPKQVQFDSPRASDNVRGMINRAVHVSDSPLVAEFAKVMRPIAEKFNLSLYLSTTLSLPLATPNGRAPQQDQDQDQDQDQEPRSGSGTLIKEKKEEETKEGGTASYAQGARSPLDLMSDFLLSEPGVSVCSAYRIKLGDEQFADEMVLLKRMLKAGGKIKNSNDPEVCMRNWMDSIKGNRVSKSAVAQEEVES